MIKEILEGVVLTIICLYLLVSFLLVGIIPIAKLTKFCQEDPPTHIEYFGKLFFAPAIDLGCFLDKPITPYYLLPPNIKDHEDSSL